MLLTFETSFLKHTCSIWNCGKICVLALLAVKYAIDHSWHQAFSRNWTECTHYTTIWIICCGDCFCLHRAMKTVKQLHLWHHATSWNRKTTTKMCFSHQLQSRYTCKENLVYVIISIIYCRKKYVLKQILRNWSS